MAIQLKNPGDERAKKPLVRDERDDRTTSDRPTEERHLDREENSLSFRQQFSFDALPNLPAIPGYKTIWLTTQNPRDTIANRIRLGYEPVRPEDVPGWDNLALKSGEYEGMIGVNEMLAFKLPVDLWNRYMTEMHHTAPLEEEGKLKAQLELMRDSRGRDMTREVGDGMTALDEPAPTPRFD